MYEVEQKLKRLLGIPEEETLISLQTYEKKGKTYYRIITYSPKTKGKRRYHVSRKLEPEILSLWKEREEILKKERELEKEVRELLRKYKDPEFVKRVIERVYEEGLRKEARDYAYEKFKTKAFELYEEFKPYLIRLKKEGLRNVSLLQALYLLANVKEMFKEKREEELSKALKRAVSTIIVRDKNPKLQNPFGVLKSDMFIPSKTEYDFLLSPFLEAELSPIFEKLLEAEKEKIETQETMAQITEFVAMLSDRAKERVLKAFKTFEEFAKVLYELWKKSGENMKEFLKEWEYYLELEVLEEDEDRLLEVLKKLKL